MSFEIRMFKGEDAKIAADIALKHRLYVSGWRLSGELKSTREGQNIKERIAIAYSQEIPIGVCFQKEDGSTHVFVRKSERKVGVGRSLVKQLAKPLARGSIGCDPEMKIWRRNGYAIY
ncbi:hypothetical protein D3C85_1433170 [compost metagenome]